MTAIPVNKVVDDAKFSKFHMLVIGLCSLLMIIDGYDMISYGSVVAHLMGLWDMSPVAAGLLGAAALLGMLVGGMGIAPLADKYGRRPLMLASLTVSSLASLGCALSTGVVSLGIFRFLVGVSLGAMVANLLSLVGEYAPRKSRAFAVSFVGSVYSVGGILAAALAIYLIPNFGWQSVFILSILPILFVPVLWQILPESPEFLALKNRRAELEKVLAKVDPQCDPRTVTAVVQEAEAKAPVAKLFAEGNFRNTILIWVVFAMTMLLSYGLNTWLPTLMTTAGYPLGSGLFNLVILNVGGLIGAMAGGWLADRWTLKRALQLYFVLAALSLVSLASNPAPLVLNLLLMVAGATTIGTLAIVHALAVEYYPSTMRSTGVGWAAGVGRIGAMAGPILGGTLLSLALPFEQNFMAVAVPGVIGAIAISLIAFKQPAQQQLTTAAADSVRV